MPEKDKYVLQHNHEERSMKVPFIFYAGAESALDKIDSCNSNTRKSLTTKINKHIVCGYSSFTHCSFDNTKNKHDHYKGKNYLKIFSKSLKKHAIDIISYESMNTIL